MIENYTMDPNSTSLFILTLRESYKLSDSRVILYLLLPSILGPPLPHTGARVMSEDMRDEVCLKSTEGLRPVFYFYFLIWNDCAFINSLQAGASETA